MRPTRPRVIDAENGIIIGRYGKEVRRRSKGYVVLVMDGKKQYVHRVIWESVHGPIPPHLEINHINGIKHDNRIANLELVTHQENMRHCIRLGLRNTARGERSPRAVLTDDLVRQIRALRAEGVGIRESARRLGVRQNQIENVVYRRTWAHVA